MLCVVVLLTAHIDNYIILWGYSPEKLLRTYWRIGRWKVICASTRDIAQYRICAKVPLKAHTEACSGALGIHFGLSFQLHQLNLLQLA